MSVKTDKERIRELEFEIDLLKKEIEWIKKGMDTNNNGKSDIAEIMQLLTPIMQQKG